MLGKEKLLFQFKYVHKRDMITSLVPYVCSREDAGQEVDDTIYGLPQIGQGQLSTINGDPVVEVDVIFERGVYFSIFYCLCFLKDI